jgi:hypothetical protein
MENLRQSGSGLVRETPESFEKPFDEEGYNHRDDECDAVDEQSLDYGGFHRLGCPAWCDAPTGLS